MEHESSRHENEVARLNAMIDLLLLQNKALLAQLSLPETGSGAQNVFSSHHDFFTGRNTLLSSHQDFQTGRKKSVSSSQNIPTGAKNLQPPLPDFMTGRNNTFSSHDEINTGRKNAEHAFPENDTAKNNAPHGLPDFVEPAETVVVRLTHLLKDAGVTKVRRGTLRAMAVIILRAHNKQDCSHRELRKATGHSDGGIAKLLMAMKKRGLIFREGYKRFGISASARGLLKRAAGIR